MKIYLNAKKLCLYAGCIFLQNCVSPASKPESENIPPPEYYSAADFAAVEKYDTHVHINTDDSTFIDQAKKDNLRLLTVNVNSGEPVEEQRRIAEILIKKFPDRLAFATTFNLENWGTEKWQPQTIAWLKE